jgi:hypothetical protein
VHVTCANQLRVAGTVETISIVGTVHPDSLAVAAVYSWWYHQGSIDSHGAAVRAVIADVSWASLSKRNSEITCIQIESEVFVVPVVMVAMVAMTFVSSLSASC